MEYSDDYLREELPSRDPENVPREVEAEIETWIEQADIKDPQLIARSTRWTYAMFHELRSLQFEFEAGFPLILTDLSIFASLQRVSIGLFDRKSEENGFGPIIHIPQFTDLPPHLTGSIRFTRLGQSFKVLIRQISYEDHIHPTSATTCTLAQCNSSELWGFMTAGHALPSAIAGQPVPLQPAGVGTLVRSEHPPIDAAFVGTPGIPSNPTRISTLRFPSCGRPMVVETQAGRENRTVVATDSEMDVTNTRRFPVHLWLDTPCSPGDSGALVRTPEKEACGMYLGSVNTPNPKVPSGFAGRALNFEQAVFALDVTAYISRSANNEPQ